MDVCMGGRVAEELIFGENEVTSGASWTSELVGFVSHNYDDNGKSMSTETRLLIEKDEKEVRRFLERAYNNAKTILTTHSKELHALANALLQQETLSRRIKSLLSQVNSPQQLQQTVTSQTPAAWVPPSAMPSGAAAAAAAATAAAKAKGVMQPV